MWISNQKSASFKERFKRKYGFDLDNLGFWWPFLDEKLHLIDGCEGPSYERFEEWLLRHSPFSDLKEMWDYIHYVWKYGFSVMPAGETQYDRINKNMEKIREFFNR